MKFSKMTKITFGVMLVIIVSNIPPMKYVLSLLLDDGHYRYSNSSGSFTVIDMPFKNDYYNYSIGVPKKCSVRESDTIIYRLFSKNPLCFWRLGEYLLDKRYKLPYKDWNEIKKERGYSIKFSNSCQNF